MKKSLLATVAAVALIASAGMASAAEGGRAEMKAGGNAEMNKGADVKGGADVRGKPTTTGAGPGGQIEPRAQGAADSKSGPSPDSNDVKRDIAPKASTSGQASEQKSAPGARSTANEKAAPAVNAGNSGPAAAKSAADEKSGPAAKSANDKAANDKSATGDKSGEASKTTAQGAAGAQAGASVNLTTEQKTKVRTTVLQSSSAPKVSKSQINFNISVGTAVPRSVRFVAVPQTLVEIHPQWRGYSYFIVDDEIIIVDSNSLQIVAVLAV